MQPFPYWMFRWCFPLQIVCISLSLTLHLVLSYPLFLLLSLYIPLYPLFFSMQIFIYTQRNVFHKMKYDLKGHMRPLLCRVIFKDSQVFWTNFNLIFRSYGHFLSLLFFMKISFVYTGYFNNFCVITTYVQFSIVLSKLFRLFHEKQKKRRNFFWIKI